MVATGRNDDDIEKYVGTDSLRFLTVEGMLRAIGNTDPLEEQLYGTFNRDGQLARSTSFEGGHDQGTGYEETGYEETGYEEIGDEEPATKV